MTIRLGLIGSGSIGEKHVEAAVAGGVEFGCVMDTDKARATKVASLCEARPVDDVAELLADESLQGVVVAVPNFLHKPLAIQALEAGKDVLLEKPMGLNTAECDEINKAAAANGRVLQIGLVHRYSAVGQHAKKLVESGRLGDIYHAKAALYQRRGVPGLGGWFTTKSKSGGGALIDLGVHLLDLSMHILGYPSPTQLTGTVHNTFGRRMKDYVHEFMWAGPPRFDGVCDVDDAAHAMIRFGNGCMLELNVTWAANIPDGSLPDSQMMFLGDQAGMSFPLFGDHILLAGEDEGRNADTRVKLTTSNGMELQIKDFVRAIETREVLGASGADGRTIQSILDAIYRSSDSGENVTL